jgi:hypothetical protein
MEIMTAMIHHAELRRELFYAPEGRDQDGNEIPARETFVVQYYTADGGIASPVGRYYDFEKATGSLRRIMKSRPWLAIDLIDTTVSQRMAYRRHGIEIPEGQ